MLRSVYVSGHWCVCSGHWCVWPLATGVSVLATGVATGVSVLASSVSVLSLLKKTEKQSEHDPSCIFPTCKKHDPKICTFSLVQKNQFFVVFFLKKLAFELAS